MTLKFIADNPALYITDLKTLVVTDLHIGLEYDLFSRGIVIPPQAERFQKVLGKLIKITKAKQLIILGDLKYKVPGMSIRELKEIPKLLEFLVERVKVILVKGNHDDQIEKVLPERVRLVGSRGLKIKKYGFFHGHAWPSQKLIQCDHLFMGHIQPSIEFKDKFGHRIIEQVWVKAVLNKEIIKKIYKINKTGDLNLIILPSFNKLSGSLILNKGKDLHGPFLENKALDIASSNAFLLDGTELGIIKFIKPHI